MATHYPHAVATGTLAVADRSIVSYASVVRFFFKREQNDAMEDRDGAVTHQRKKRYVYER